MLPTKQVYVVIGKDRDTTAMIEREQYAIVAATALLQVGGLSRLPRRLASGCRRVSSSVVVGCCCCCCQVIIMVALSFAAYLPFSKLRKALQQRGFVQKGSHPTIRKVGMVAD
jgi:hypothetical protein